MYHVLLGFLAVTANVVVTTPVGDVKPWRMLELSSLNSSSHRPEQHVIPENLQPVIEGYMAKHRETLPLPLYRSYKSGPFHLRQLGHDALRSLYSSRSMYQRVPLTGRETESGSARVSHAASWWSTGGGRRRDRRARRRSPGPRRQSVPGRAGDRRGPWSPRAAPPDMCRFALLPPVEPGTSSDRAAPRVPPQRCAAAP
ncbi:hypothetical protein HPB52_010329 [Rhipicephalus sanguineus]|uniref:Uncharacterized protein n=1 Tax=Rhipicephalus sanguineus TaxID=34632 RepID=A0A9D4T9A2_RHISA|nr:hypothetical protein HPB52_010329 [Rhipicephalus sanguineus]